MDSHRLLSLSGLPPVWALGTSVVSPPLAACLQENFPADLGGRSEGGAGLLPSNLDSWVYGRKHREADAVIKAIPEAVGGDQERSPPQGWPPTSLPLCQKSQPQTFSRLLCLTFPALAVHFAAQETRDGQLHTKGNTACRDIPLNYPWGHPSASCGPAGSAGRIQTRGFFVQSTPRPQAPSSLSSPPPTFLRCLGGVWPGLWQEGPDPAQGSRPGQQPGPEHQPGGGWGGDLRAQHL